MCRVHAENVWCVLSAEMESTRYIWTLGSADASEMRGHIDFGKQESAILDRSIKETMASDKRCSLEDYQVHLALMHFELSYFVPKSRTQADRKVEVRKSKESLESKIAYPCADHSAYYMTSGVKSTRHSDRAGRAITSSSN